MKTDEVIVVTGAAGFIGSCMAGWLNRNGRDRLILADKFGEPGKEPNLAGKKFLELVDRDRLFEFLDAQELKISVFIHLGARTDTTEFDYSIHKALNVDYSKRVWAYCTEHSVPLIYASSAATYGDGEQGYSDDHARIASLKPLNPYGVSKQEFDLWALRQEQAPPAWAGLKFFNVYGPNEYHKARMASVIFHAFGQIRERGWVNLFRSHKDGFADGGQLRDFIYVKDILDVIGWIADSMRSGDFPSGIYNLGTGKARTFADLAGAVFAALNLVPDIRYIDMPEDIRDKYQYYTQAEMTRLRKAGFTGDFTPLEKGVEDYVRGYLVPGKYY